MYNVYKSLYTLEQRTVGSLYQQPIVDKMDSYTYMIVQIK